MSDWLFITCRDDAAGMSTLLFYNEPDVACRELGFDFGVH